MITTKKIVTLGICTLLSISQAVGQKNTVHRKKRAFLGVYGGVNYSLPKITEKHSVLTSMSSSEEVFEKDYDKLFQNGSHQFGMYFLYGMTNRFSLVFQPAYYTYRYKYQTSYSWSDTVNYMNFEREMHHDQQLYYFSLPVLVRWDMTKRKFSPYLQLGVYTDLRHRASKSIGYDPIIDGELNKGSLTETERAMATDHINKVDVGLVGGIGLSYFSKYFVIGLESNFRYGFLPLINDRNRYADLTGFTGQHLDVPDQLLMRNINFQIKLLFPIDNLRTLDILRRAKY